MTDNDALAGEMFRLLDAMCEERLTEEQAARILTLPINQTLSPDDIVYVADCVNDFLET